MELGVLRESPVYRGRGERSKRHWVREAIPEVELRAVWQQLYELPPLREVIQDRLLFEIMVSWAPRNQEITGMRWRNVSEEGVIVYRQKGGEERKIELEDWGYLALMEWGTFGKGEYLFQRRSGQRQASGWIARRMRRWWSKAGFVLRKNFGSHYFRHSLATRAYVETRDIDKVRELMGHKDLETTRGYIHAPKQDTAKLAKRLRQNLTGKAGPLTGE
jgi:site-specific recombinase XerC